MSLGQQDAPPPRYMADIYRRGDPRMSDDLAITTRLREAAESRIGWKHEGIVVVHKSVLLKAAEELDNSVPKDDWLRTYNEFLEAATALEAAHQENARLTAENHRLLDLKMPIGMVNGYKKLKKAEADLQALQEREERLRKENAYLRAGLGLVAESRWPESILRGYQPGSKVSHAVERWSLEPFCEAKGLLILNEPWADIPPGFARCEDCVAALSSDEAAAALSAEGPSPDPEEAKP